MLTLSCASLSQMMDEDRDDHIAYDEFKKGIAMSGMRPVPTEAEMKLLFGTFDVNGDQNISYQEMLWALEADDNRRARMARPMNKEETKAARDKAIADKKREQTKVVKAGPKEPARSVPVLRRELLKVKNANAGQLFSMSDDDRDDFVSLDEFKRGVAMSGMRPVPSDEEMSLLFASFDVDGDLTVSFHEMCWALEEDEKRRSKMGRPMNRAEAGQAKREAIEEKKKAPVLQKAEPAKLRSVTTLRATLHQMHRDNQLLPMMDENKDNTVTFEEFKRGVAMCGMRPVPSEAEFRALFRSCDLNANGVLSYEEMVAGLEKDQQRKGSTASGNKVPTKPATPKSSRRQVSKGRAAVSNLG